MQKIWSCLLFIKLYYGRIVSFIFWKNSRIAKSPFKMNWPLVAYVLSLTLFFVLFLCIWRNFSHCIITICFSGTEKLQLFEDLSELDNLLTFILKVSELTRLKRTGWVRAGIRDPERVAGHMYRMAVMALFLEEDSYDKRILNGSAVIVSLVHDIAG